MYKKLTGQISHLAQYKIQLMNKNYTRYGRGGMLMEMENQKNHYKMLLQPRKSMSISEDSGLKLNFSLYQNNKFERTMNKMRQQENERLYRMLESIRMSKGTIQLMSERAKQEQKSKKKSTLVNQYKILEKRRQLREGNRRIVEKIGHVKPRIGNSLEWDQHYEKVEKQKKKISRVTQHVFDVQSIITDKDGEIKNFFRQTLDFHHSKVSKGKERKNKTVAKSRKKKEDHNKSKEENEQLTSGLNEQQLRIIKQEGQEEPK